MWERGVYKTKNVIHGTNSVHSAFSFVTVGVCGGFVIQKNHYFVCAFNQSCRISVKNTIDIT